MKPAFRLSFVPLLAPLALCACAASGTPQNGAIAIAPDYHNMGPKEGSLIANSQGRVRRSGDDLLLSFANGKTRTFHNDNKGREDGPDHCDSFVLAADLPQFRWFLVYEGLYEGGNLFLFDYRTGEQSQIPFWPVFSPDGQRILFVNDDVSDSFPGDNFEIWRRQGSRVVREWAANPDESDTDVPQDFGPYHGEVQSWLGDRITLTLSTHDTFDTRTRQTIPGRTWPATLTRSADGWHLKAKAP